MRTISFEERYEYFLKVDDEKKLIIKLNCLCKDFEFRRRKKVGEYADIKYFAEPCKHLKPYVDALIKQGYNLKKPAEMIGATKLTIPMRRKLMERANYECECGCGEIYNLEVHRKVRGSAGGKYNEANCEVLTHDHHALRHANEFPGGKSK